jgi:hypothetical protein
MKELHHYLAK